MARSSSQAKNSISSKIKVTKEPKARLIVSLFSASSVWFRSKVIPYEISSENVLRNITIDSEISLITWKHRYKLEITIIFEPNE